MQPLYISVFARRLGLIHSYICGTRLCPPDLYCLRADSNARTSSRTNHTNTVVVPRCKTVRFSQSAIVSTATAYNTLSQSLIQFPPKRFQRAISSPQLFTEVMTNIKHKESKIVSIVSI